MRRSKTPLLKIIDLIACLFKKERMVEEMEQTGIYARRKTTGCLSQEKGF